MTDIKLDSAQLITKPSEGLPALKAESPANAPEIPAVTEEGIRNKVLTEAFGEPLDETTVNLFKKTVEAALVLYGTRNELTGRALLEVSRIIKPKIGDKTIYTVGIDRTITEEFDPESIGSTKIEIFEDTEDVERAGIWLAHYGGHSGQTPSVSLFGIEKNIEGEPANIDEKFEKGLDESNTVLEERGIVATKEMASNLGFDFGYINGRELRQIDKSRMKMVVDALTEDKPGNPNYNEHRFYKYQLYQFGEIRELYPEGLEVPPDLRENLAIRDERLDRKNERLEEDLPEEGSNEIVLLDKPKP